MANASTSAARFTRHFTDAQKNAFLTAVLVNGHTIAAARRMAKAGQLGVPAFEIGTYAYRLVDRSRDSFEAINDDALAKSTRDELKRLHRLALAKSRTLAKTTDVAEIARVAKALAETERALNTNAKKQAAPKTSAKPATANEPTPDTGANVVASLLDHAPKNRTKVARTGSLSDARNDPSSAA